MATATQFPTGNATASGVWTNGNTGLNTDDGTNATFTTTTKNDVRSLTVGTFGFDAAIPSGATINSVAIEVQEQVTSGGTLRTVIRVGGVDGALNDNTSDTALTVRTYSALTRPGGGSWTRADLLDGTLTARFEGRQPNNTTSRTYLADYLKVIVDYTAVATLERAAAISAATGVATAGTSFHVLERSAAVAVTAAVATAGTVVHVHERSAGIGGTTGVASAGIKVIDRAAAVSATTAVATAGQRDLLRSSAISAMTAVQSAGQRDLLRSVAIGAVSGVASTAEFWSVFDRAVAVGAVADVAASGEIQAGAATHERAAAFEAATGISASGSFWSILERSAALTATTGVSATPEQRAVGSIDGNGGVAGMGSATSASGLGDFSGASSVIDNSNAVLGVID